MSEVFHSGSQAPKTSLSSQAMMDLAKEFEAKYPEAMNILYISGVSPFGSRAMTNPYTGEEDIEDFSNVGRHCVAVAYAAGKLATALGLDQGEKDATMNAALLHDGDKRLEVMRKKAKNAGVSVDVYGEAGYQTIESVFTQAGIAPEVLATMKDMGGMTGHNSLKKFVTVKEGKLILNPERSIIEMIVHIADSITYSSHDQGKEITSFVPFRERAALSKFSEKYPFMWKEGFSVSEPSMIQEIRDIAAYSIVSEEEHMDNYYDWQENVFEMISFYIQKRVDPSSKLETRRFLVGLVNTTEQVQDQIAKVSGEVWNNLEDLGNK